MRQQRIMAIAAKIETTYGVDATPSPSTGAIEASGIAPKPYQGSDVSNDAVKPFFGNVETFKTGVYSSISFSVALSGSGTAGTAPAIDPLLRACGFASTITPTTSVAYDYVGTTDLNSGESVTIYCYLDGELHKMRGCRGNAKFGFDASGLPKVDFDFNGFYAQPVSVDFSGLTFDYSAFLDAVPVSKDNTPVYTVFGQAAVMSSLSFDPGLSTTFRNLPNFEGTVFTDRKGSGSTSIDAPDLATINFFQKLESHNGVSKGAIALTHGITAGNIVELAIPSVQITSLDHGDSDGILQYNLGFNAIPTDAGNDEFSITFK